jgi:hypothetical protein
MRAQLNSPESFEFYFPELDNLVLVENHAEGVVIRATRANFSERRKIFFIRELAAEGYIPDWYQWFSTNAGDIGLGVRWVVDYSWLKIDPRLTRQVTKFMRRLLLGVGLLWLVLMGALFLTTVTNRPAAPNNLQHVQPSTK